ncbi:MAG: hypothetical protein KA801_10015 [Syntrophorhabdaceae bacterium]|nr:hypothetical protein [Syntrophorhabdaceae bacterium]
MLVLGIHTLTHDTCAALVENGRLIFAVEEERLRGVKHTEAFPELAIQACLRFRNITMKDIDAVAVSYDPVKIIRDKIFGHHMSYLPDSMPRLSADLLFANRLAGYEQEIRQTMNYDGNIYFCHHHTAHFASSYLVSRFDESALFSIDGCGDFESAMIGFGQKNSVSVFDDYCIRYPQSLGFLYTTMTDHLGFLRNCDEGKVMGLAPYGNPATFDSLFQDIVTLKPEGRFDINMDYFLYQYRKNVGFSKKLEDAAGPQRIPGSQITQRHRDLAAAVQLWTEKVMLHVCNYLHDRTQCPNLSMAGGVSLNCVANGRILAETPFKRIFIQPAANDAGTAIGAALYYYYSRETGAPRHPIDHAYLGNAYRDEEIEAALNRRGLRYTLPRNLTEQLAGFMKEGKIIGWFSGRMEIGPRALGNRSILTAPFPAEMKDILNSKVKHREPFRPFAPIVRLDECGDYFEFDHESPYMLLAYRVRDERVQDVPAITHIDGTARVQTVTRDQNNEIYELISEFKRQTGVGVILNTSFNVMGQPIVETPEIAIDCFMGTQMDYLVFNNRYLVEKQ